MNKKIVYFVCPVRNCPDGVKEKLDAYVAKLEKKGYEVHYPHRNVNQEADGIHICDVHCIAMMRADEVHLWWIPGVSTGSYFDFGMAYMLKRFKPLLKFVIANPEEAPEHNNKSYYAVLLHIAAEEQNEDDQ